MSLTKPPRYHLPTHLNTPDTIDLPLFGVTISLTMRQGIWYLLGWSMAFHLWQQSLALSGILGVVHWGVPVVLAFLTFVIASQQVRGRHLEHWALVLARYLTLPKVFVWRGVLLDASVSQSEESAASGRLPVEKENDEEAV